MDQWVLHRMRRKEMKEHPNLQIWESVLAEVSLIRVISLIRGTNLSLHSSGSLDNQSLEWQ